MFFELRPSENISEIVSVWSKNYAYMLMTGDRREKTMCKVRDKNLNYNASKIINFDVIGYMILKGKKGDEPSVVNVHMENKIKRKRNGAELYQLSPNPKKNYIEFIFQEMAIR